MCRYPRLALVTLLAAVFVSCREDVVAPQAVEQVFGPPLSTEAVEGELLGNVYDGTARSTETNLYFDLIPADPATISYLSGTNFEQSMWINPSASSFSIEYFNPESLENVCGNSYTNFINGNLAGTAQEVHASGPGSGVPSGFESHCIIPGTYRVQLRRNATVLRSFFVDYIPSQLVGGAAPIATASDGKQLVIESPTFNPSTTRLFPDLVVNFHLNPSGSFSDTPNLQVENALGNVFKTSFANQSNPSGKVTDWFRYRTDLSTGTWALGSRGRMLMGVWWDNDSPTQRSGFFDHAERPTLRVHRYQGEVTPPTTVTAGLEVKRPDENPASAPTVTKNISIVVDPNPVACFNQESLSTWKNTDQYLDASCSSNGTLQYRWDVGSGFGSYSSSPHFESFGYPTSGNKTVRLEVRNTAVSPPTTNITTKTINVINSLHSLSGPAYVTDKTLKTYTASASSSWWERYDPPNTIPWYQIQSSGSIYTRIWPAGEYTRGLRAQRLSGSGLARGRIDVVVCHESIPGCQPQGQLVAGGSFAPTSSFTVSSDWHLFGGGPWISTRDQVVRFYDLTGLHDADSPFASTAWLTRESGEATSADGRFDVSWQAVSSLDPNVKIMDFVVRPASADAYRFGMALDPDLGTTPANDRSGHDASRGLVYAVDGSNAVGFVLLSLEGGKVRSVDQYGAQRFAPRAPEDASKVGEGAGARLSSGEDDVQFIVTAEEQTGAAHWRLVIVRGGSVGELRSRIDAIVK